MTRRLFSIVLAVLLAAIGAMVYLNILQDKEAEKIWLRTYEMTNKNIEWTGAGYNGFYK